MKIEFSQSVIHVSHVSINYDPGGGGGYFLSTCNRDMIQRFFFCLQELEKFSDIDEVRLIYFS